jgi:hypothetical protein
MMSDEQKTVKASFIKLKHAKCQTFPKGEREALTHDVPNGHGVYVIYFPDAKKILHVGRTSRAKKGLRQRLKSHLYAWQRAKEGLQISIPLGFISAGENSFRGIRNRLSLPQASRYS